MNVNTEEKKMAYYMTEEEFEEKLTKAVKAGRDAEKHTMSETDIEKIYYRKTERLLYAYPDLQLKVKQDQEDLKDGLMGLSTQGAKSKDMVRFSKNQSQLPEDLQEEAIKNSRIHSMLRTMREIERIDNALEKIRWKDKDKTVEDPYFAILELKYFYGMKEEDIAELDYLKCNPSTIYRNKSRLVCRLKNILFGADALPK